ncbi:MAG: 16S rRNA methyltransferase [Thermofilum sp. ex4484_79]|nr:MAG: 16S rRNA methyltransferase [Thermofilum sp. ex4484_79]
MLHICLVESGLELVPKEISKHPLIRRYAKKKGKKPSKVLLDISFHYHAMKNLKDFNKRGRPDIVHFCLLEALGSPLNKMALLRIYVHTYDGKVVFIDPSTRIPKNYIRFVGLMEQLLDKGKVPPNSSSPLLWIREMPVKDLIGHVKPGTVILLDEKGKKMSVHELAKKFPIGDNPLILIGGFQRGNISQEIREQADYIVSIFKETLETWIVISRILCAYEHIYTA